MFDWFCQLLAADTDQVPAARTRRKFGFFHAPPAYCLLLARRPKAERSVLLQLLRDDHAECWERFELETQIPDIPADDFLKAVEQLNEHKLVGRRNNHLWAAPCVCYLDALGMIAI